MKILFDLTSLYDHITGIERYAMEIALHMINTHPEDEYILIFKNQVNERFQRYTVGKNCKSIILKGSNKLIFNQFILPKALKKIKADAYLFLAFPKPILFSGKKSFGTIHDMSAWDCGENMKFLSKWYFKISNINTIHSVNTIITISEFSKGRILHYYPKADKKIELIYAAYSHMGQEENKTNTAVSIKYNLPEKYILSLSTLEPRKNLKLLLKCYDEILNEGIELPKLVLAGRMGWKLNEFLTGYSEKLSNNIVLTGFIEDKDLYAVYGKAEYFVFPSIYEGFGIPPLDAMGYGVAVLSSDGSSLAEILGDAAFYFKNNDKDSLKSKLLEMNKLAEDEKNKHIKAGFERIKLFNWGNEADKLYRIIKRKIS